ncbi:glycoside hydrolase family 47 protein [Amanita thiersii Skay4041]|uniref:alpha-1,2-Mannosidase n=1 Tax=Amanita thiersii Skay4041 TaxID=703135 RepID=A0A2A9NG49_9AGAR|nr:glycoside hydrolase family 47 protein [Amanita thiersii Skay4041]
MSPPYHYHDPESFPSPPPRHFLRRPFVRWLAFGCVFTVFIWSIHPTLLSYSLGSGFGSSPYPNTTVEGNGNNTLSDAESGVPFGEEGAVRPIPGMGSLTLGGSTTAGIIPPTTTTATTGTTTGGHGDGYQDNIAIWKSRKEKVRDAYRHALEGYMAHAFPNDELMPLSGGSTNKYNGWGVSLIDSMDTMWVMGLHDEFYKSVEHVAGMRFLLPPNRYAPFFETIIRYLGGLLSAYALSGEPILLARADDLGQKLLPAFNGTESGLPAFSVHPQTGETRNGFMGSSVLFAEATSCQLEFKYLAKMTGRKEYYEKVENIMSIIYASNSTDGLFAERWMGSGLPIGSHITAGAGVDSGYEYLLKQWLLSGDVRAREQYIKSANGIINNLVYISPNRRLLYATDLFNGRPTHKYEHLTCFLPGLLALGAEVLGRAGYLTDGERRVHMWAAEGLGYTCYVSYRDQETGLGPDVLQMTTGGQRWVDVLRAWEEGREIPQESPSRQGGHGGESEKEQEQTGVNEVEWEERAYERGLPPGLGEPPAEHGTKDGSRAARDYSNRSSGYLLRPETVESLFLLWKTTGDPKWRERGWEIFNAIDTYARTEYGFANVLSIDWSPYRKDNDMPSWFLAETLKYLYLLFDDGDVVIAQGGRSGAVVGKNQGVVAEEAMEGMKGKGGISLDKWVFNTEAHPFPVFEWTEWERRLYNISS